MTKSKYPKRDQSRIKLLEEYIQSILVSNNIHQSSATLVSSEITNKIVEIDQEVQFLREIQLREFLSKNIKQSALNSFLSSIEEFNLVDYLYYSKIPSDEELKENSDA